MRIVDLNNLNAFIAQQFDLAPQNRHAVPDEFFARRIRLRGLVRVPHPLAQQRGSRQRRFDFFPGDLLEERNLLRDETRLLRREPIHDNRPRPAVFRIEAQFKSVSQFGDDPDVRFPPPLAVGHDVQPGRLLQRDDGLNRRAHQPPVFVLGNSLPRGERELVCWPKGAARLTSADAAPSRTSVRIRNPAAYRPRCNRLASRHMPCGVRLQSCPAADE